MATETSTPPPPVAASAEADGGAPSPAKPKSPLLLYGAAGLLVLALGAAGWFLAPRLLGSTSHEPPPARHEEPIGATVSLGSVVVNIGPPEARRYLKIGVELGVPGPKHSKEIEERKPQILDLLITVLSTTPVETLSSGDGRAELKRALLRRIREELGLEKVSRVYFTEFLIQ